MCGIIGVISFNKKLVANTAKALMLQSEIRGKHATGISYYNAQGLVTLRSPEPVSQFQFPEEMGNVMIGHVRYSTSNIEYNQPITEGNYSLVHNGVITQAPFEEWESLYGFKDFATKNDSEILLKAFKENMFCQFPESSIAAGILVNNEIVCWRNEHRPLYMFNNEHMHGFASTENIILRALGKSVTITKAEPNILYNLFIKNGASDSCTITKHGLNKTKPDLQFETVRGYSYLKGRTIQTG